MRQRVLAVQRKRPLERRDSRKRLLRRELREMSPSLKVRLERKRVLGSAAPGCATGLERGRHAFRDRRFEADQVGFGDLDRAAPDGSRRCCVQQLELRPITTSFSAQGAREDVVDPQRPPHGADVARALVVLARGRYGTDANPSSSRHTGDDGIGQAEAEVFRLALHVRDVERDDRERGVGRQRSVRISRPRQEHE